MFVNFSAIMLRFCEPFLDANMSKKDKVDPKYVFDSNRLELRGLTVLHASSEEISNWINRINPGKADVSANNSDGENRLLLVQAVKQMRFLSFKVIDQCQVVARKPNTRSFVNASSWLPGCLTWDY
ncbi:unnamed protein product [Fraxinus pennsylvanica]|uniref:Ubiquitin conjugation factor E4 core domain-containing protein n=1 Tax=Fraxinus pennsylvanica TaxID=56036 RepID=A0AAD2E5Y5_9LAMI|nr:unnamed protein product [Fraxinus pennsylvanica]